MPSSNADTEFLPFHYDGAWLDPEHWEQNLRRIRSRAQGLAALAALRAVFKPAWSRQQAEARAELHPIASPAITVGGRDKLLELGTMAAVLPLKKVRPRLLSRKQFTGTA
jgi:hypothetical protein